MRPAPPTRKTKPKCVPNDKPLTKEEQANRRRDGKYLSGLRHLRPKTRRDCKGQARPCPWASCRYHLYLEVTRSGSLRLMFPDREIWEIEETCALDAAARGGMTLERVGVLTNSTMERIRQVEEEAAHGAAVAVRLGYGAGWKRPGAKLDDGEPSRLTFHLRVVE